MGQLVHDADTHIMRGIKQPTSSTGRRNISTDQQFSSPLSQSPQYHPQNEFA
jgi:hypothetical protein